MLRMIYPASDERGIATAEFAISIVFLIGLLLGLIDTSMLLYNFSKYEQAAREGSRLASRFANITPGPEYSNLDLAGATPGDFAAACNLNAPPQPTSTQDCGHAAIHTQIRRVLSHQLPSDVYLLPSSLQASGTDITTLFHTPATAGGVSENEDSFEVRITGVYRGLLGEYPLEVSYQSPWLFHNVSQAPIE